MTCQATHGRRTAGRLVCILALAAACSGAYGAAVRTTRPARPITTQPAARAITITEPPAARLVLAFGLTAVALSCLWLWSTIASGRRLFPPARLPEPNWTELDVVVVFVVLLLVSPFTHLLNTHGRPEQFLAGCSLVSLLMVCLVSGLIRRRGQTPAGALGLGWNGLGRRLAPALAVFFVAVPLLIGINRGWRWLLIHVGGPSLDASQKLVKQLATSSSPAVALQIIVAALLVAPLAEEMLFRGLIYRLLRKRVRTAVAVPAVGVLFGVFHAPVSVVLPMCLFGGLLCYLYEKTGRLVVPIAIHFLFNLCQVTLILSYRLG